jgi:hypothetical protein
MWSVTPSMGGAHCTDSFVRELATTGAVHTVRVQLLRRPAPLFIATHGAVLFFQLWSRAAVNIRVFVREGLLLLP